MKGSVIFEGQELFPSKVVCVGRNYKEHIDELKNEIPSSMVLFLKPNSSISKELYYISEDCHYECEISFLIKNGKIAAVALGLDLTKRDLQKALKTKGLPWERAKAFDNAAVFGEFIAIDEVDTLNFELFINGELKQKGFTEEMIYKPLEILKEISSFMSLVDNDIVMSGTPSGVGRYKEGDTFHAKLFQKEKLIKEYIWSVKGEK
ncbi:MAG: fumarylacetoacetate hydrolase family protein [Campylobacteraceae bacterium]|jgi:2-keto-4-pentenoate hydratase/2-oxohepta-3-ene-1,7-dioic acid hydratase in catechol pathway|nr:fumarylacetoacetate hydrolase family protein [Campylobacteraceae bacterium]